MRKRGGKMATQARKKADPPKFMRADEVAEMLYISRSHAYKIIKQLNKELEEQGKITTAGRVSRRYFEERCI